jgi:hypothetical protein
MNSSWKNEREDMGAWIWCIASSMGTTNDQRIESMRMMLQTESNRLDLTEEATMNHIAYQPSPYPFLPSSADAEAGLATPAPGLAPV